jgi:nicotinamidase-related amidase
MGNAGNIIRFTAGWIPGAMVLASLFVLVASGAYSQTKGQEGTIVDQWKTVQAPAPPELKPVTLSASDTALLVLDIQQSTCNAEQRPRCVESLPKISELLRRARSMNVLVAHSLTSTGKVGDILPGAAPAPGEPLVKSSVDKFYGTDLEKILRDRGIRTVVIAGTAANGAVLHTATGAAMRGFQVIVPVDLMSADLYAEQYTAWHLVNAPGSRRQTTLTRSSLIEWKN